MAAVMLPDHCFDAADGDPCGALVLAVRATRWQLIANGFLDPEPGEDLPAEVWRAREERQACDNVAVLADRPGRRYAWFRFDRQAA